jgi:hypothetical protein
MAELTPLSPQPPETPTSHTSARSRRRAAVSLRARTGGEGAREKRSTKEFAASVAMHLVVGVAFLQFLTFGHGWSRFLGFGKDRQPREERVTFVTTRETKPPVVAKTPPKPVTTTTPDAQRLRAPTTGPVVGVPSAQPEPVAARPDTGSAAPGTGAKGVGALDPNLVGVKPGYTDVRVWRGSGGGGAASAGVASGRDRAEKLDSIMRFAITAAGDELDSAARANGTSGRKPGDWTKTDANGNKWGWDGTGIRLGKVTIPNALLGLLPLNAQRGMSGNYTDMQRDSRLALAREDIMRNVDRALGEVEFRKLVNELRDRREKERRDRLRAPDPTIAVAKPTTPDNK